LSIVYLVVMQPTACGAEHTYSAQVVEAHMSFLCRSFVSLLNVGGGDFLLKRVGLIGFD